jgi:hypothetical protein
MSFLFSILVMIIIMGVIWWIVTLLPFPEPFKNIALVIIGLIFLLYLLSMLFGMAGPLPVFRGSHY